MAENNQKTEISLQINAQYIKDLSFEAPQMPQTLLTMKKAPQISVNFDVSVQKTTQENVFTVELTSKVEAKDEENDSKVVFLCELTYGALVSVVAPETHLQPILLVEVPHLLFPFVRSVISNITRESGLPPLQINPIDFASLYQQRINAAQKESES